MTNTCPHCGAELATAARLHCEGRTCGWISCNRCASRIDRKGRHTCIDRKACLEVLR